MAGEDGVGQVVEPLAATAALVPLAVGLGVVATGLDGRGRTARGTDDAVGPPHVADGLEALGIVEDVLNVHHHWAARGSDRDGGQGRPRPSILANLNAERSITPESILSLPEKGE